MDEHLLYSELAGWWSLISPPEEYAEDAALAVGAFALADGPVRKVLELGSGGGHHASHLAPGRELTLVDLSAPMLEQSRRLNPGCAHIRGDMRRIRLGRVFDAVLILDAVHYLTAEADLAAAVATAFAHCRPGGVAVFLPDQVAETFRPGSSDGGSDGEDGRSARYLCRVWDPDPADTWTLAEYTFVLREPGAPAHVTRETHRLGLFRRDDWLRLLHEAGFRAHSLQVGDADGGGRRWLFAGVRPAGPGGGRSAAAAPPAAAQP